MTPTPARVLAFLRERLAFHRRMVNVYERLLDLFS
jgi:hypothetical protein